jgi:two-component sensor histidine kinase
MGFVPGQAGLGTQIVQALVGGEMRGKIIWSEPPEGGTVVEVDVMVKEVKARLVAEER